MNPVVLKPPQPTIETENARQILFQIDVWYANKEYDLARKTWKMLAEQAEIYAKKWIEEEALDTKQTHPVT